jgi:hypothetical protein
MTRNNWLWAALALILGASVGLATPDVAMAQSREAPAQSAPAPAAAGKVTVEVMVVHATEAGAVDPKLKDVVANLKHTNFKGFKLLDTQTSRLAPGGDTTISLVGNRRMRITVLSRDQRQAKLRIRMFKEGNKVLDTTVTIPKGRYFMIAGPKHKGGKLILPVGIDF